MTIRINRRQLAALEAGDRVPLTEADLLKLILDLAKLHGWRAYHQRPARTKSGWRTACQGSAGFPDLVLARGSKALVIECKAEKGVLSDAQRDWLDALSAAGIEAMVARPSDWNRVVRLLSEERP